jgi:hypothetical protein
LVLLAGCSGDDEPERRPDVPRGFDVPAGVVITKGGSTLRTHTAASVVIRVDERATSVITVKLNEVAKGDIKKDFTFFSLDASAKKATPFYVRLTVRNEGPSGLGGVAIPVLARSTSKTVFPPSEMVGDFKRCPNSTLPKSFLPDSEADLCLVFLLPKGQKLSTIDLQTGAERDAIHWRP